ncbi:uncharacterized protein N7484_009353 [Penicillium longicatenatum]|uniref:uncharacterized protein n=1 Tax=Penicillium longicatenatum TaxID=1561947 RepID=UPI002546C3B9|nr:uncharacterized protein N7484_009353 [Penicillium longicatenatum]KAJ5636040.1 hypothetical protein N7484_009353 [Penicillium longicatenatum]
MGQAHYYCHHRWSNGPPADTPKSEEEALARIDELYSSGAPWFSKETIRSALEQIQRQPAHGDKIFVKAIDGAMVEYDTKCGDIKTMREPDGPDTEWVLQGLAISYQCRANMRHRIFWGGFDEQVPNLNSVYIVHSCLIRRKDNHQPTDNITRLPLEVARADFEKHQQAWIETEMCRTLTKFLDSSAAHLEINKIVAVSLGCLSYQRDQDQDRPGRQSYQHALVLTLRDWLRKKNGMTKVPCYVQDPEYVDVDRALLAEHEVEVIEDPMAWLEMDDFSIVVSIASNVPTKEIITDVARPAVVIWNKVGDNDYDKKGEGSLTDPCSARVRALMEGYDCFDWGASDEYFGDVWMYVRRPKTLCQE